MAKLVAAGLVFDPQAQPESGMSDESIRYAFRLHGGSRLGKPRDLEPESCERIIAIAFDLLFRVDARSHGLNGHCLRNRSHSALRMISAAVFFSTCIMHLSIASASLPSVRSRRFAFDREPVEQVRADFMPVQFGC